MSMHAAILLDPLDKRVMVDQVGDTQKVLFHPYSRQQMASILRQQVQQLPGPVFEPMALSLCAAKVRQPATPPAIDSS
jgi:Cdc6-like AAA superfamily ATPase